MLLSRDSISLLRFPLCCLAQSTTAVEYTDSISAEGKTPPMSVLDYDTK